MVNACLLPDRHRPGAGRLRFALALTLSVLFHIWLGTGIVIEVSGRSPPSSVARFTAQLQQLVPSPELETSPERSVSSTAPEFVQPLQSRLRVTPPAGYESASKEQGGSGVAPASIEGGEALGVALQTQRSADPYYTAQELDVYPAPRAPLRPEYPESAARAQVRGRVLVMLSLDEAGIVNDISVISGEPQGYFEDAARAALGTARFFPAQKNGLAVKSRILISLEFDPAASVGVLR